LLITDIFNGNFTVWFLQKGGGGGGGGGGDKKGSCKKGTADIVFGIDVSWTMALSIQDATKFVINFLKDFLAFEGNRVGVFLYTTEAWWSFPLKNSLSQKDMFSRLREIKYDAGNGEEHGMAIRTARNELLSNQEENSKRKLISVLITDAQIESDGPDEGAYTENNMSRDAGISNYVVATEIEGERKPEKQDLLSIFGRVKENIFKIGDEKKLYKAACSNQ